VRISRSLPMLRWFDGADTYLAVAGELCGGSLQARLYIVWGSPQTSGV
jgi:hypothetical protein